MNNKYIYHAKISEQKFKQLLSHFVLNLSNTQTAALTGLNRTTVNRIIDGIRTVIFNRGVEENWIKLLPKSLTVSEKLPCGIYIENQTIHLAINQDCSLINNALSSDINLPQLVYDSGISSFFKLSTIENESENGLLFSFSQAVKLHQKICFGIPEKKLVFHMAELVFKFNNRNENKYNILLKWLRENPINSPGGDEI